MRKTRLPAFSLPSSLPTSAVSSSQPWYLWSHKSVIFLLVVFVMPSCLLVGRVNTIGNFPAKEDNVQKRSSNDDHLHQDVKVESLKRLPEVIKSDSLDNPRWNTSNKDQRTNSLKADLNKQAALQKEVPVLPDKGKDVPLDQKLQGQQGDRKRNEDIEYKEILNKKKELKRLMEDKEKLLNEKLKQHEQEQQQGRNKQQNILETQKEQQREQNWLRDVHRKSQEALAERHNQEQLQQQPAHPHSRVNQSSETHDRPAQLGHVNEEQPDLSLRQGLLKRNSTGLSRNNTNNFNSNKQSDDNSAVNNNLKNNSNSDNNFNNNPDALIEDRHLNDGFPQEPLGHGVFVLEGKVSSIQDQNNPNSEIYPAQEHRPQDTSSKVNNTESSKKIEPSVAAIVSVVDVQNSEANKSSVNSVLGIPVVINEQNANLNSVNQNEQIGSIHTNPPNVANNNNNNNQWPKYELNNVQQQQQEPQQQQQQNQQPQIGGINLSWDWEDFSVMFASYGAAEMKVRRSPHPTTGEPWPLPQYYSKKDDKVYRVSKELHFIPTGVKCDILEEGLTRHLQRTLRGCVEDMYDNLQNAEGSPIEDPTLRYEKDEFMKAPLITRVEVKVRKPCDKYPSLESDESYDLVVKKRKTYIWANEVWGALRGLETFGHLVWRGTDGFLYIKETVISDYPRFPHRGLHIDTSRHFLFKEVILDILDSMEMNKLNVFHWHIVDDQSFPYESKVYPELSRKGAFHPTYVYTLEDIAEIIEYARLRGIRVMPEFDTPGHTYAWGLSRPELLTQCYSGSVPVKGYLGPIDPSKNSTYRFLQTLFKEIMEVFKDQYLHLGGDEVPLGCWQSNPEVSAFAQELAKKPRDPQQGQGHNSANANFAGGWNVWSDDIRRVYEYYENRLINILNEIGQKRKKGIKYVMWQEVMNNNLQLPNDTIIQVWMGDMADVMRATSMGYQVIYSTCWYMDHIEYGTKWPKYYNCDPVDQSFGFHIDEKKVLGGEAAFWAEYFSNENLIPLMWPRASAAAERLWSSKEVKNLDKAAERLSEHRCRMIKRGINAGEINGPGYCLHSPPKRRLFNDTAGCKGGNCSRTHNFVQIEDFEVHVSHRGGSLANCGNVFTQGNNNVFILLILALVVVVALYMLSKSSSQFHRMRICKNRSILIVFVGVLLVYILCYTTIWMRAFEFSGSFHKTLQEDNRSGYDGANEEESKNFRPISS